jgi:Arc/MetJ-type ribon-helix-helix transcriptional regulator
MNEDKVKVHLKKNLYERIKKEVEKSQGAFTSVEEYLEYVIEELLKDNNINQVYSKEDEEKIKERLRLLGYIE